MHSHMLKKADKIDEKMGEKRKSKLEKKEKTKKENAGEAAMEEFIEKVENYGLRNMDDMINYVRAQINVTRKLNRSAVFLGNTLLYTETGGILASLKHILDLILLGNEVVRTTKEVKSMNEKEEAMNYV